MQKTWSLIRQNIKWIIVFVCIGIFLAIAEDAFHQEIMRMDVAGQNFVHNYLYSVPLTAIFKVITQLGGPVVLISLTILLFFLIKNKKIGLAITVNLVITVILNQIFKFIVQRPRPEVFRLIDESGYSFPSGHSMCSMAFYGFLIYLIFTHVKNIKLKWASSIILALLILSIGLSRIYLGVHYVSDVIAGFIFSFAYLIVYISFIREINLKTKQSKLAQK